MPKHKKDWQAELENRQRNIVFPDTVRNETNFLRSLFSGMPLTRVQRIGAAILGVTWIVAVGLMLTSSLQGARENAQEDGRILSIAQGLPTIGCAILMFALSVSSFAVAIFAPQKHRTKKSENDHQHASHY
jgi:hypothetical protein